MKGWENLPPSRNVRDLRDDSRDEQIDRLARTISTLYFGQARLEPRAYSSTVPDPKRQDDKYIAPWNQWDRDNQGLAVANFLYHSQARQPRETREAVIRAFANSPNRLSSMLGLLNELTSVYYQDEHENFGLDAGQERLF